jgi:hypothetical protein
MEFQDQVGTHFELFVSKWTPPQSDREVIGFGAVFEDFDRILYANRTPEERKRDAEMEKHFLDDYEYDFDRYTSRRADRHYGSMRIFSVVEGESTELVVNDKWEVEVVRCYLDPRGSRTKDNRRRLRFNVRPIKKIERVERGYHYGSQTMCFTIYCGQNYRLEEVPCEVRKARFRLDQNGERVVDTSLVSFTYQGTRETFWHGFKVTNAKTGLKQQVGLLGNAFDSRRYLRQLRELPPAPDDLRKAMGVLAA